MPPLEKWRTHTLSLLNTLIHSYVNTYMCVSIVQGGTDSGNLSQRGKRPRWTGPLSIFQASIFTLWTSWLGISPNPIITCTKAKATCSGPYSQHAAHRLSNISYHMNVYWTDAWMNATSQLLPYLCWIDVDCLGYLCNVWWMNEEWCEGKQRNLD